MSKFDLAATVELDESLIAVLCCAPSALVLDERKAEAIGLDVDGLRYQTVKRLRSIIDDLQLDVIVYPQQEMIECLLPGMWPSNEGDDVVDWF